MDVSKTISHQFPVTPKMLRRPQNKRLKIFEILWIVVKIFRYKCSLLETFCESLGPKQLKLFNESVKTIDFSLVGQTN